ncbi:uncharacterized protein LOC110054711 isoform X2 [Orbicella faveolata]|uniref:uncharacterized protein LOC110054679 isoform X2 n=1 Tax=Orbicella faveolata TaxID=48498 RepID=UPI0009E61904|nr:uncharacterized protein LOC110054679 isoform X2 [Orbicella faveolata]XP_020616727.1 uncharacterized protein LOC110054711 isoform X2 [Orbicella faveolata]
MQTNDTGENYGPLGTGVCSQVSDQAVRSETDFVPNQLDAKEDSSTTQTYSNNTGSPPPLWHDITLNNNGRSDTSDSSGCPDTYENMTTRMGEIEKTLASIKDTVTTASVRCHLLNVDVVTMFSPEMVDTLSNAVEQCESCIKTMETSSPEDC